jgi:hypothetical protein
MPSKFLWWKDGPFDKTSTESGSETGTENDRSNEAEHRNASETGI